MPEKEKKTNKKLKISVIILAVLAAVFLAAFLVAFLDPALARKVRLRLGLEHEEYWTDARKAVTSWENTLEKMDIEADVVFFGDSLSKNSDFRQYFPDLSIVNLGMNGDTITGMQERVKMIAAVSPSKVFILGGVNALRDDNLEKCVSDFAALLDSIRVEVPDADICVQSILPISREIQDSVGEHDSTIRSYNEALRGLAEERGMDYADIYPLYEKGGEIDPELTLDGVHITDQAYSLWAEQIKELVYKDLPVKEEEISVRDAIRLYLNELNDDPDEEIMNAGDITQAWMDHDDREVVLHAWNVSLRKLDYDADTVFFGDSLIMRSDFGRYFPDKKIVNLGCGGDTIKGACQRAEMTGILRPEKIFIMCGVNALRNNNLDECVSDYDEMLDLIEAANSPDTEVYILSILPVAGWIQTYLPCSRETAVSFNESLKSLADEHGMEYIDLYSLYEKDGQIDPDLTFDGVHLEHDHGYDVWADAIRSCIYD